MSLFTTGPRAPQIFGSSHVSAMSGISLRRLHYWDEHGIVCPDRVRGDRVYSPEQVVFIMVLADLLSRSRNIYRLRKLKPRIVEALRKAKQKFPGDLYLITDGKRVELATSMSETLAVTLRFNGLTAVHLSPIISIVRACQEKKQVA